MIELSVENLHLTYGDNPVLKGVSMDLKRGEVVSLLGPSGSGKTTLLRAVAGLEKPTQGRIIIGSNTVYNGSARSEIPAEERNLGLVFQSYALWPHKTVFENVAYPLKLRKVASAEINQRVQGVLDQLGLGHLGKRHPHQLSGGQQQRVAIGRALVYNPPVILLDEPLSNLDAKLREEARVFLRELIIKLGLSALMVTHDQNEAMAISDRILLLNNGENRTAGHAAGNVRCTVHPVYRRVYGQQ
ncbi:Maltose/maltodextrin import ATP-binding protein MalK [Serratia grimesii]|nr:Maltose/maltodextrin import ATP-binding protein MalK [Serratia grimesii]